MTTELNFVGVDGNNHSEALKEMAEMERMIIDLKKKERDLVDKRGVLDAVWRKHHDNLTPVQRHTLEGIRLLEGRDPHWMP